MCFGGIGKHEVVKDITPDKDKGWVSFDSNLVSTFKSFPRLTIQIIVHFNKDKYLFPRRGSQQLYNFVMLIRHKIDGPLDTRPCTYL